MTERLIRLLRILMLIQGKPGILARELADRCETTERTLYRDLELLSAFAPISNLGHGRGYTFVGNFSMYPLNLTDEEALVLSMLPSLMQQVKSLLPSGFNTAHEKIMAAYRKEKAVQADLLQQVADIIQMGTPVERREASNDLALIIQGILSQKSLKVVYHSQGRNTQTERIIDPYYLVPRNQRFYLIGYCHLAGEIRTFRVSRFVNVEVLDEHYDKSSFDIRQYMRNTFSIERGDDHIHFQVRFSPEVARYVTEEEWFVEPKLTTEPDGSLLLEMTLNHDREFLMWVTSYGPEAEILSPPAYRDAMRNKLARWREIYG
jgi:predicted DNA-binding transcriptional regulator YafY